MEHANKAFLMVGGMLFAIMILSLVAFVFSSLTTLPTEQDINLEASQIAAFNNEYTAYDKKIMYGVDVISVLNKAKSNNDKYVQELFVTGGGYNVDFIIDIVVETKSKLEETMEVSYLESGLNRVSERDYMPIESIHEDENSLAGPCSSTTPITHYKVSDINKFKAPSSDYQALIYGRSNYWDGLEFKSQIITTNVAAGEYHIIGKDSDRASIPDDPNVTPYKDEWIEKNAMEHNTLAQLLTQSTVMSQTINNRGGAGSLDTFFQTGWSKAVWKPATYDLKTRKFKCDSDQTVVSEKTGRIVKMVFREI